MTQNLKSNEDCSDILGIIRIVEEQSPPIAIAAWVNVRSTAETGGKNATNRVQNDVMYTPHGILTVIQRTNYKQ